MRNDELWFILIKISNEKKVNLIKKYKDEENIRKNKRNIKEFSNIDINEVTDDKINNFKNYIKNNGIGYITINYKEYPNYLTHVDDPPYVLFYKGNLEL